MVAVAPSPPAAATARRRFSATFAGFVGRQRAQVERRELARRDAAVAAVNATRTPAGAAAQSSSGSGSSRQ